MLGIENNSPFQERIDKLAINDFPLIEFKGTIHLVNSQESAAKIIPKLMKETVLGFDTESKPSFRRDEQFLPSLLQLSSKREAFLIQINKIKDKSDISMILANPSIKKVGVAIKDDLNGLMKQFQFAPEAFIDLADLARIAGIQNTGLRSLCGIMLNRRISKSAQVSNWAKSELTEKQVVYAATDAWISRELYMVFRKHGIVRKYNRMLKSGDTVSKQLKNKVEKAGLDTLKHHILFCSGNSAGRCCPKEKSQESLKYLQKRLRKINETTRTVYLSQVDCLGICNKGPIMVVYPEGAWYYQCTPEVIERILQNHLLNNKVVKENLLAVNRLK